MVFLVYGNSQDLRKHLQRPLKDVKGCRWRSGGCADRGSMQEATLLSHHPAWSVLMRAIFTPTQRSRSSALAENLQLFSNSSASLVLTNSPGHQGHPSEETGPLLLLHPICQGKIIPEFRPSHSHMAKPRSLPAHQGWAFLL